MGHQKHHYLKLKGATYYYTRRVPKPLWNPQLPTRVEVCLFTSSRTVALKQALMLNQEYEDHWQILRRRQRQALAAKIFSLHGAMTADEPSTASDAPTVQQALETYLSLKSHGRGVTFVTGAQRSIGYFLEVVPNKPIDQLRRQDANALREFLKQRGLARDSIGRNFTNVRAVINFALQESGLPTTSIFSNVYLGEERAPKKRYVPSEKELTTLTSSCRTHDDQMRWALALMCDTGLRLSEALGLHKDDVRLDADIPHLIIAPRPWRRLKTASSERNVPLVGNALWASQRAYRASEEGYLFPRYIRDQSTLSNSASAAMNKWLKQNVSNELVVHSLRHAFRDRLRNVGTPTDVIDVVGGWARAGIGETYGRGHSLITIEKWMQKIV